jgi:folate-dependent phosphoribosylglycinamide formyltransferase PurN
VTDRSDRGCVEKAKKAKLPYRIVEKKPEESREEYDVRVHETINELSNSGPHISEVRPHSEVLIAAIGWMHILSSWFIQKWPGRILNVHPALLPKYGGEGMFGMKVHEAVLASSDRESGMTIHLMDEGVDTGQIIVQKKCSVSSSDSKEKLKEKVQALEKEWYPKVLQMIELGEIKLTP